MNVLLLFMLEFLPMDLEKFTFLFFVAGGGIRAAPTQLVLISCAAVPLDLSK